MNFRKMQARFNEVRFKKMKYNLESQEMTTNIPRRNLIKHKLKVYLMSQIPKLLRLQRKRFSGNIVKFVLTSASRRTH